MVATRCSPPAALARLRRVGKSGLSRLILPLVAACSLVTGLPARDSGDPRTVSPLRVSADGRALVRADARTFFWLGDTAWELFSKLTRDDVEHYLTTRRQQGFNVLQAIILPYQGHHVPNRYGETPFLSVSPEELVPNEAYFRHADWLLDRAEEKGFYVVVMPAWRYFWREMPRQTTYKPILTPANTRGYAEFLARRYQNRPGVMWGLGGDQMPENDFENAIAEAFAAGLRAGGARQPITYHPGGGRTSSLHFHDAPWLDFSMAQSGHRIDYAVWDLIGGDWNRQPPKPILDGESVYEDIPVPLWLRRPNNLKPRASAYLLRRAAYASVFAGGFGYTYGANTVFQFYQGGDDIYFPSVQWKEGLHFPAAWQMRHLRALMESRPLSGRVPDQSLLVSDALDGANRITATRAGDGSYALIYTAGGKPFTVRLEALSGTLLTASWYSPRTGGVRFAGQFPATAEQAFTPPSDEDEADWVLVLDDAARGHPSPGRSL